MPPEGQRSRIANIPPSTPLVLAPMGGLDPRPPPGRTELTHGDTVTVNCIFQYYNVNFILMKNKSA